MERTDIDFKKLPDAPGVYRFIGPKKDILYVGRATSLRDRVRSYFVSDISEVRSPLIAKIIRDAKSVSWEETDSVLEAIILEAKRIKEFRPVGNTDQKDNKSFAYLAVTDEEFPRFLIVRERELSMKTPKAKIKALFGPFTSATILKDALKIIRKIFPFFDTPFPIMGDVRRHPLSGAEEKTVRFNQSIGLYPKEFDDDPYKKTVRNIILFFEGKKKTLLKTLEREMKTAAQEERFEDAGELKRQLFALTHIQDVTLIREDLKNPASADFRVEGYDIAHLRGESPRGVMTVVINEETVPSEYRTFTLRHTKKGDDIGGITEVLERRFNHPEWRDPQLVVIDGGKAHLAHAKRFLAELGAGAEVVSVVKDEKHRPKKILGSQNTASTHETSILLANSEAHRFALARHRRALRKRSR